MLDSFSKRSGKSKAEVEKLWNEAKDSAATQGHTDDYPYIVGILKRMLSLSSVKPKILSRLG